MKKPKILLLVLLCFALVLVLAVPAAEKELVLLWVAPPEERFAVNSVVLDGMGGMLCSSDPDTSGNEDPLSSGLGNRSYAQDTFEHVNDTPPVCYNLADMLISLHGRLRRRATKILKTPGSELPKLRVSKVDEIVRIIPKLELPEL